MFPVTETLYEGVFPSGQRGQTVNLLHLCFGGPNPPASTRRHAARQFRLLLFSKGRFFFLAVQRNI